MPFNRCVFYLITLMKIKITHLLGIFLIILSSIITNCHKGVEKSNKINHNINNVDNIEENILETRLIVKHDLITGEWYIWDEVQRHHLTYCVSNNLDNVLYSGQYYDWKDKVITAMEEATEDWEDAAYINFIYQDEGSDCDCDNENVIFNVRFGVYTDSFFPNYSRSDRELTIRADDLIRDSSSIPRLTGILRHELGHILGFGHEHFRCDGCAGEDPDWDDEYDALTQYDYSSVMHYHEYNNDANPYWELTYYDKQGAVEVYPFPEPELEPEPDPCDPCDPRPCVECSCLPEGHCLQYCDE